MPVFAKGQITIRIATDNYAVYQSVDKAAISCDHTGKVSSPFTLNSIISVHCGDSPVTDFIIGAISKPAGFSSITTNHTTKTITYSVNTGDTTLADTGTIAVPVTVDGQRFTASFVWYKVKAGSPGADSNMLDWVMDWNGGKTVIDSQSVITPKIFAGTKNANGTITGIAVGKFPLNTRNTSGSIVSETVNGIYGFNDGKKSFFIDSVGNVQLGSGNERIGYNVSTGKVEFGPAVSLNWIGATYINADGLFTGTLSAATVNAVRFNASQIAAGTIDTARLNTDALKASLITAKNIEALTLNVTRGTVGGWSLDSDSVYRGTKNNTAGAHTTASGAITIGSNGIRGYKWRLDSAGSGAVAGNNIVWDADGNVTFSPAVSLLWNNAAANAANRGKLYVRGTGMNHHAPRKIMLNGSVIHESNVRGLALTVITRDTLAVNSTAYYDVYASESVCDTLANALNALEADKIVVLSSCDSIRINDNLNTAIQRCGGADVTTVIARVPFALIGIPGIGKNNGVFAHYGQGAAEPYAELSTLIINGTPQGISVNGQRNTFIDGNGIYTGTLNANQITAGIIDTERLDAASIRTNIINTGYINGLNCTFVRGKIGGFTIGSDNITSSGLGFIGTTPLQIRTASSGTGNWFSGGYKPFGITLTWFQTTNAGHISFGEIAATGNSVKTGFIGIQMMTWDSAEYFCLSANHTISGVKEVYNRIAGWAFDNQNIWKNNVSLGADGSIVNGTKWRLDNDGSGQVANGNIIWDTAGNVTFGASVSLNWTNAATSALNSAKSYADQKKAEAINSSATDATSKANAAKELASAMAFGKMLFRDPTFITGMNGISIFNALPNDQVAIERVRENLAPNDSKMVLEINSKGATLPGCGGFSFHTSGSCKKIFITRFIAKIPLGRVVEFVGTVTSVRWLTSNISSGDWQEYVLKVVCTVDKSSTLSSFYIEGEQALTWQLAYATVFDVTSSEGYTTTIDANGIYTASLNAGQITAGTIDTERLDAAGIKANIINTDYINGLSCTFVKGKIGGFTIDNSVISIGNIGNIGEKALQIRSSPSGSGAWFSGSYKPFGVSMVWHQTNNAGHVIFGEIAASGSTTRTGFIGIQMMSWDGYEYFCLSANSSRSGAKEVYNRIAGWTFDNQCIYKNNVYLGSDGSVYNGTRWRLNSDGSGRLANGNIVWDAVGKVTFGPEVSLNWTNAAANALNSAKSYADEKKTEAVNSSAADATLKADAAKELASAMAGGKMLYRDPTFNQGLNGIKVYNVSGNGTVTISRMRVDFAPNDSNMVLEIKTKGSASPGCGGFGFETAASYRKVFIVRFIANIPPGKAVQFFTNSIGSGGSSKWLTRNIGMGDWQEFVYKVSCGIDNFSTTNFFYIEGTGNISWQLAYATVFDVTSAEGYTTTIDANGIYTASLNAGQITAGTISADRLSAGSINASKLDAASIKASIINTAYINGLNCTFTKGVVGGWKIAAGSITASNSMPGHTVSINSAGYLYNSDGSTNYWALNPDGSAVFGKGKIGFNADGSGKLASGNIVWDVSGNVTMTGKINANSGTIGGFKISTGWIGSTATASGTGGGLALYDNFLRVGYLTSYAMFGENTFPSGIGGYGISTGRITNEKSNPVGTNYGLYIDVRNGYKNCAVSANAPIVGSAVYGNKIKNIYFTSTAYTLDFSQNNIFFVYANQTLVITLPAASAVAKMFGYSALPSDFAYVFTFIYNYSYGNTLFFQNIRGFDGKLFNASMNGGDVLCLMIANFPDFHYQLLWKGN